MAEIVGGIICLLLLACGVLALSRKWGLPFSVMLVVVGMLLRLLSGQLPHLEEILHRLTITPELIFFVFLPTLIFESSFNLDSRQLRHSLSAVLLLAVPGLLISTAMIAVIVSSATEIPLAAACLLGAILSATDPVAVVALFKRLGAPQRLTILVEGESLFNDATALVLAGILTSVALAGTFSAQLVVDGILNFFVVFVGGLLVGALFGYVFGWLLGRVNADALIEITLTMTVAYLSFLVAEEVFHVSGVMAVVASGIILGGWGWTKISLPVRGSLEHFWEYLAFIANALIFLLVGLRIDPGALWGNVDLLLWVIGAMLVSRAVVVYGLTPLVGRKAESGRVGRRYQTVMFWGGLRGAIAIAIVLSLPEFPLKETFITIVCGAVLFTLLVQGLSMEALVGALGLSKPPTTDRHAELETALHAKREGLRYFSELNAGGQFSALLVRRLRNEYTSEIERLQTALTVFRDQEITADVEHSVLYLRCFAEERAYYADLFDKGHLSERTYRQLSLILALQTDAVRFTGSYQHIQTRLATRELIERKLLRQLDRLPGVRKIAEQYRLRRIMRDYELDWGHFHGSGRVLDLLDGLLERDEVSREAVTKISEQYRFWRGLAQHHLDQTAAQFPEFIAMMQERLGRRLALHGERRTVVEEVRKNALPSVMEKLRERIDEDLRVLRGGVWRALAIEPIELLKKVPCFAELTEQEFALLAERLRPYAASENEAVITQGERGDTLFLIARGVVRVSIDVQGEKRDLATLLPGDFFGEMALLHDAPRSATVKAVTPCALHVLKREDLNLEMPGYQRILQALTEADQKRRAEQETPSPVEEKNA